MASSSQVAMSGLGLKTQVAVGDGSVAVPSVSFAADSNTGLYRPGSDVLGVVTGGVERMRVDAAGNVGVGTGNPGALLDVNGTANTQSYSIRQKQIQRILIGYQRVENGTPYYFTDAVNIWKNTFTSSYTRSHNNSTIEVVLDAALSFAIGAVGTQSYGQLAVRIEFTYPNGTKEYSDSRSAWLRIDNSFYEINIMQKVVYKLSSANSALLTTGQSISAQIQLVKTTHSGSFGTFGMGIWGGTSSLKFKEHM